MANYTKEQTAKFKADRRSKTRNERKLRQAVWILNKETGLYKHSLTGANGTFNATKRVMRAA